MSCCAQCTGIEKLFDEKGARKDLAKYKKKGTDKATRVLMELLRPRISKSSSLLDIGGGVGVIQLELMETGVSDVTNVDASTGYLKVAEEEARERGLSDRVRYLFGDFVDVHSDIEPHDVVTLDKVICCYPDMKELVRTSASKAKRYYALVYPKNQFIAYAFQTFLKGAMTLIRNPFRMFIHKDEDVDAILAAEGFTPIEHERHLWWQVRVFERLDNAPQ